MRIHFFPFTAFNGITDISSGDVFLSSNLSKNNILDVLQHERWHFLTKDHKHHKDLHGYSDEELPSEIRLIGNMLGMQNIAANIGNISGIQNILTDYHLLQAYRKFSQRILGTEGQWEFKPGSSGPSTIRLFPIPRGSFPVIVEYLPSVSQFKKPSNRELVIRGFLARMKMILGRIRGKFAGGIPGPDGSTITFDGESLIAEGKEEWDKIIEDAISLGEPLGPIVW